MIKTVESNDFNDTVNDTVHGAVNNAANDETNDLANNTAKDSVLDQVTYEVSTQQSKKKCCDCFEGMPEAQGYAATAVAKGTVLMSGMFFTSSILHLANEEAGCLDLPADECTARIHGFKPSSLVPLVVSVAGLMSAFLMPVIGALLDFTPHRRATGIAASTSLFLIQAAQIATTSSTWFAMLILRAFAGLSYDIQNLASQAYFPEIGRKAGEEKTNKFMALFSISLLGTEFVYLIFVIVISIIFHLDDLVTAQVGQGVSAFAILLTLGYGWSTLPEVPALHSKPENIPLLKSGFSQLWCTAKGINIHYGNTLRWFFIATSFAEAGSNAFTTCSLTYMIEVLHTSAIENGYSFIETLLFASVGAKLGSLVTAKTNPIISMQASLFTFALVTIVGGLVLSGPDRKPFLYLFGPLWGLVIGWEFTAQNTFFALSLPKGQEAEFSGFYSYCSVILSWLPPLIFSVVNEAGVRMQYALMTLAIFPITAASLQFLIAPWKDVRQQASTLSKNLVV